MANIEAIDGGAAIAAGNARVLSARLSDAKFFWDEDRKVRLEDRLEKLKGVTFHAKLGTMYERVERIEALAREIAPLVGADPELAAQAARLAKADLGTRHGRRVPRAARASWAATTPAPRAWPTRSPTPSATTTSRKAPATRFPTAPVSVAVALADKLDTLVGFFAIDEKPTGSRTPLRCAAPRWV